MNPEIFSFYCASVGFDLEQFEAWLGALPDAGPRRVFSRLRDDAVAAFAENDTDATIELLDALFFAWQADYRLDVLDPRARGEIRRIRRIQEALGVPEVDEWIKGALKKYPEHSRDALWGEAPDWIHNRMKNPQFRTRVSNVRKKLKKPH